MINPLRAVRHLSLHRSSLAVLVALTCGPALAQVTVEGDVLPASYPLADIEIGVINQIVEILLPGVPQVNYERGENIQIGATSYGAVRINGGADLRWEHLVMGGTELDIVTDDVSVTTLLGSTTGVGVLRIEGFGSSLNLHPQIIPTQFQDIYPFIPGSTGDPEQTYFNIAEFVDVDIDFDLIPDLQLDARRRVGVGFDAVVGLTGRAELYINSGARMEVEDAFIVALGPDSSGYVEVDGIGTYLGVYGGLNPNALVLNRSMFADDDMTIHQMIIGGYGEGEMRITNGAIVDAFYGAAIGVTRSDGEDEITDADFDGPNDPQGSGRVIVDGPGSSWNVAITAFDGDDVPMGISTQGGALAIGEFEESLMPDYTSDKLGQGYLSIRNDGLVQVRRYTEETPGTTDDDADVRIGRMGTLDFRGGKLTVRDQTISDGLIQAVFPAVNSQGGVAPGEGRIETGSFQNRSLGDVRVGAGQKLSIVTTLDTGVFAPDTAEVFVGANMGLLELIGDDVSGRAEFDYDRQYDGAATTTSLASGSPRNPEIFYNAGEMVSRGQIVASNSTLRFRNGIWNSGDIQFTGGQNTVSGPVMNAQNAAMTAPLGVISIMNSANVAFEGPVTNDGTITISDNSSASFLKEGLGGTGSMDTVAYHGVGSLNLVSTNDVYVGGNFALGDVFDLAGATGIGGTLRLAVESLEPDGFSHLVIDGDADFDFAVPATIEILELAPPSGIGPVLLPGDEFEFITVLGTATGTGTVIVSSLPSSGSPALAFMPEFEEGVFSLVVVEDNSIGADFNGDGVVDAQDVATWQQFHGLQTGASGANGDVDLDGDVDTTDYGYLIDQYGGAGQAVFGVVPEPASLALIVAGLLAYRRRR